jgi:hypothetical protein
MPWHQYLNANAQVTPPFWYMSYRTLGRVIAQAVSVPLLIAAARLHSWVSSCEFRGGQSGIGAGSLRVLVFPLPILIPPAAPYSSIIRDWYNKDNSGRCTKWTQSDPPAPRTN